TSPDIPTIYYDLYPHTKWQTIHAPSSDHLPILITIDTKSKVRLNQNRRSYTNYKKANWTQFTEEIEHTLTNCASPKRLHSTNITPTNIILNADKHNIPKGKINAHHLLLPNNIRDKINARTKIRKSNSKEP